MTSRQQQGNSDEVASAIIRVDDLEQTARARMAAMSSAMSTTEAGGRPRQFSQLTGFVAELDRRTATMLATLDVARAELVSRGVASAPDDAGVALAADATAKTSDSVARAARAFLTAIGVGDHVVNEFVASVVDDGARGDVDPWEDAWVESSEAVREVLKRIVAAANGHRSASPVVDALDRGGRSALHYAAGREGGGVARLRDLIADGFDVNLPDRQGFTPLFFAAEGAQPEQTVKLIAAGADLEARDAWGNTALGRAILVPDPNARQVARILLEAGADPDAENNYGRSARDVVHDIVNQELKDLFDEFPPRHP